MVQCCIPAVAYTDSPLRSTIKARKSKGTAGPADRNGGGSGGEARGLGEDTAEQSSCQPDGILKQVRGAMLRSSGGVYWMTNSRLAVNQHNRGRQKQGHN